MTEYDYSPEAYERYLATRQRISRWVDDTNAHSSEFQSPFERPRERLGTKEYHGSTSAGGTRSGAESTSTRRNSMSQPANYDWGRAKGPATQSTQRPSVSQAPQSHRHTYPYAVQTQAQAVPMTAGAVIPAAAGPVYAIQSQRRSQSYSPRPQSSSHSHSHSHRHGDDSRSHSHHSHHHHHHHSHSSSQHHSRSHGHATPTRSSTLPVYYVSTSPNTLHSSPSKSHRARSHSTPRTSSRHTALPVYTSGVTTPTNSPTYVVTSPHGKPSVVSAPAYGTGGYAIIAPKGKNMKVIYP